MSDPFDQGPVGYRKGKRGWHFPVAKVRKKQVDRLAIENEQLKLQIEEFNQRLAALESSSEKPARTRKKS